MSFVGPDSPISEPNQSPQGSGFVGPDSPAKMPPSLLKGAVEGAKASLFPLTAPAKAIEPIAEAFVGPDTTLEDLNAKAKAEGYISLEQSPYYPGSNYTSGGPTLDAMGWASLAAQPVKMGAKAAAKASAKEAAKKAFLEESDKIAKLPAQDELPISLPPSGSNPKPQMGLERLRVARKDPNTGEVVMGHNSSEVQEKMFAMTKEAQAKMEADYTEWLKTAKVGDRFDMGDGNYAIFKGGNEDFGNFVDVFGDNLPPNHPAKSTLLSSNLIDESMLKASTPEEALKLRAEHIKSKGFVDAQGNFIGPDAAVSRLEGQGQAAEKAFARELPFPSNKSGKVPQPVDEKAVIKLDNKDIRQINAETKQLGEETGESLKQTGANLPIQPEQKKLPIGRVEQGTPTEPFKVEPKGPPLPPGAQERIAAFDAPGGTDIPKVHPFSTSSELVTKTGDLRNTVRDQLQDGLKAEAIAEQKANAVFKDVKTKFNIEPESLDSEVLSKYMRNPNKAQAGVALRQHLGDEADKYIQAEKELRAHFDRWRNEVNDVRRANGMKEIPYKDDYLPQIHEHNMLTMLGKPELIGTPEGAQLVTELMTDSQKLIKTKFMHLDEIAFKHLKHQGLPDVEDAIQGLEMYGREAERLKALQPHINELRATAEKIKDRFPNLAKEYLERADHIAGKQQSIDIALKDVFGAENFQIFVEATNRMKTNLIQGNPSVPLSQLLVLPSVAASVPVRSSLASAVKLMTQPSFREFLIRNSPTLQLRLEGQASNALHAGKLRTLLSAPSELVDQYTLMYGLGAKYVQGLKAGLSSAEAMREAEQFAALTQATLSKLATAPVLRSKTAQASVPFMNQVLTQARYVTTQMLRGKGFGEKAATSAKYVATAVAISALNKLFLGEKTHSSWEPGQYIPMGSAMEQGIGGPVIGGAGRILKSKTMDQALWQTFRNTMLLQRTIPAGLQVSKAVESIFRKKEKKKE